ncbi:MAG: hypothetical protein D6732_25875 [Methanobacteriota archaeon]|nr:MAG: hypothetical protein D6732_25875 [Euryarchaeota archaeon]
MNNFPGDRAMDDYDKPNPFQILELSTLASYREIVERGQELSDLAESEEQRLLYRWAIEELTRKPMTRLKYELTELPGTCYEDSDWERFLRLYRKNPVNIQTLVQNTSAPEISDVNLAAIIHLILKRMLQFPEVKVSQIITHCPFNPKIGHPPLEVKDVIFG